MLVVGTDYEFMNAVWVKNEWSRFLKLMSKDKTKVLIPCYKDMDPYDMPDEFRGLQSQDCTKLGFMQDLTRGIDKLFGRTEKPGKSAMASSPIGDNPTISSYLQRVQLFLEDEKWDDADNYCEKVLDVDPQNAEAYLGKLMADLHVRQRDGLKDCGEPFDNRDNYKKVHRFGDDAMKRFLDDCNQGIRYQKAETTAKIARTQNDWERAAAMFGKLAGYKDAEVRKDECLKAAEKVRTDKEKAEEESRVAGEKAEERARIYRENQARIAREKAKREAEARYVAREENVKAKKEARSRKKKINRDADAVIAALEAEGKKLSIQKAQETAQSLEKEIVDLEKLRMTLESLLPERETMIDNLRTLNEKRDSLKKKQGTLGFFGRKEKAEIDAQLERMVMEEKRLTDSLGKIDSQLQGYTSITPVNERLRDKKDSLTALRETIDKTHRGNDTERLTLEEAERMLGDIEIRNAVRKKNRNLLVEFEMSHFEMQV